MELRRECVNVANAQLVCQGGNSAGVSPALAPPPYHATASAAEWKPLEVFLDVGQRLPRVSAPLVPRGGPRGR